MNASTLPSRTFSISLFMLHDHEKLVGMIRRFQGLKEKDPAAASRVLFQLTQKLKRHLAWEEEILFPLLEERVGMLSQGQTDALREDHREIQALLSSLDEVKAQWEDALIEETLLHILKLHGEKETQTVFPWLDTTIDERDKEQLLNKMREYLAVPVLS